MSEIVGSPISRHDLGILARQINRAYVDLFNTDEIIVSSRRITSTCKVWGIPLRPCDGLDLNDGVLVARHREPRTFTFEPG